MSALKVVRKYKPGTELPLIRRRVGVIVAAFLASISASSKLLAQPSVSSIGAGIPLAAPGLAVANDNRVSAGHLKNGVFHLDLEARDAIWHPESDSGPAVPVFAFAEPGKAPKVPGPMIRVPAGTEMHVTIHNSVVVPLRFRGLQDHSSAELDTVVIAPGKSEEFRFRADVPGTYFYFARTGALPVVPEPGVTKDVMLLGAFIVDPVGALAPKNERVLVISLFADSIPSLGMKSNAAEALLRRELIPHTSWLIAAINGKSWPYTERLAYTAGDTIRWRVINGGVAHPMHLHGFYFDVDARGDDARDTVYTPPLQRRAVTEWMEPGSTMAMQWVPTRAGNWVFHCHLVTHIAEPLRMQDATDSGHGNHAEESMAGLVMGIRVAPSRPAIRASDPVPQRRLRLFVTEKPNVYGEMPGYSYVLQEGSSPPAADSMLAPSSTIVLRQDEPTEISVINRAQHMATIHWHGVELESYYDGVGDWSGWAKRVAPVIAPGDSFVVRLTPQRAGTFIYHSHSNEAFQIPSGLYGTLIVLPPNGNRDTTERVLLIGVAGPSETALTAVNGTDKPTPVEVTSGTPHRFRLINISPMETHTVQILSGDTLQTWRAVAKDGADLPPSQATVRRATVTIHPGETYDFEVTRPQPGTLTLKIISPETISNRLAGRARGIPRGALPRHTTLIPMIVK